MKLTYIGAEPEGLSTEKSPEFLALLAKRAKEFDL